MPSKHVQWSISAELLLMQALEYAELRLTFGDDEEGQHTQQLVWSAWRGEASKHTELIDETHFEYTTVGDLIQPEHASYWKQLCDHRQLFTADAYATVKNYLKRSMLQGAISSCFLFL